MNRYRIITKHPHKHFVNIEMRVEVKDRKKIILQLPAWRPGRYEMANFAQNIQTFEVFNQDDLRIKVYKVTKDSWHIDTTGLNEIIVRYNYYAFQMDAGSTYYDEHQLYVNPVNCLMYIESELDDAVSLQLEIPKHYQIAGALNFDDESKVIIDSYHQLADSPFIASAELHHHSFIIDVYTFHIWMKGNCRPEWDRIIEDFSGFCREQIKMFGELPVKNYHFLFQVPTNKFYHGVEHLDSTVICIGPGYNLMEPNLYNEFLGISSHELFHSWNIKSIRPVEMQPYDYSKENYTHLGYVAEGVTTYYGDLMLLRSGVFNWETFAGEMAKFIQRQFHNYGRLYQSLAESSFDTWLDGYKLGVPDRKVSMYVKGMIVAFILDIFLRKETNNSSSLDDVLKTLYYSYAKNKKGFSEKDYLNLISELAGKDQTPFFTKYVWGLDPIEQPLNDAFEFIGCELKVFHSNAVYEDVFGFKLKEEGNKCILTHIAPFGPADVAGLSVNDEIISVNGIQVDSSNVDDIFRYYKHEMPEMDIFRSKNLFQVQIKGHEENYFPDYALLKMKEVNSLQKHNFEAWAGAEW